jgi:hypothetical protein
LLNPGKLALSFAPVLSLNFSKAETAPENPFNRP